MAKQQNAIVIVDAQTPIKMGWKCPYTNQVYAVNDQRLIGYGNPPKSPNRPVGVGDGIPMIPVQLTDEKNG